MKKLLVLLFSLLISLNSYGDWVYYDDDVDGASFYLDQESIKQHNGYAYFWYLKNYLKPSQFGDMSAKVYIQGNCELNRYKPLSYIFYQQPMGEGSGETLGGADWIYPPPGSIGIGLLNNVCDIVN